MTPSISRDGRIYRNLRSVRNRTVIALKRLSAVHPSSYIHPSCRVAGDLVAEEYVFMAAECWVAPATHIGRYTLLGPRVAIVGDDHVIDAVGTPMHFSGRPPQLTTTIGRDVWIGYGSVVRRGVSIGDGAIVGAGSVVTRSIPAYEIWAGVPARKLRDRFTPQQAAAHSSALDNGEFAVHFAHPQGGRQ